MVRKNFVPVFRSRNIVTNKQFVYKKNTEREKRTINNKNPKCTRNIRKSI